MKFDELNTPVQQETYEASMAQNQLLKIGEHAIKIQNIINNSPEVNEWVNNKINLASDYIKKVHEQLAKPQNEDMIPNNMPGNIGDYAHEKSTGKLVRIVDYTDDDEGIYTISYGEGKGETDVRAGDLEFVDPTVNQDLDDKILDKEVESQEGYENDLDYGSKTETSPLKETAKMAIELIEILKNGGNIDESVQTILNHVSDNLHGVYHYETYQKQSPYREELDSSTLNKHAQIIQKNIDEILARETAINDIDTKPGMLQILSKRVNEVEKEMAKEVREGQTYEDMLMNKLDSAIQEYDTPEKKKEREAMIKAFLAKGGKIEKVPTGKTAYKNKELKPAYRKDNGTPTTSPGSDESVGEVETDPGGRFQTKDPGNYKNPDKEFYINGFTTKQDVVQSIIDNIDNNELDTAKDSLNQLLDVVTALHEAPIEQDKDNPVAKPYVDMPEWKALHDMDDKIIDAYIKHKEVKESQPIEPTASQMSDEELAILLGSNPEKKGFDVAVKWVRTHREEAEEAGEEKNQDYALDNMEPTIKEKEGAYKGDHAKIMMAIQNLQQMIIDAKMGDDEKTSALTSLDQVQQDIATLYDDAAGVGIITKQNTTADVKPGDEYKNVKKLSLQSKRYESKLTNMLNQRLK